MKILAIVIAVAALLRGINAATAIYMDYQEVWRSEYATTRDMAHVVQMATRQTIAQADGVLQRVVEIIEERGEPGYFESEGGLKELRAFQSLMPPGSVIRIIDANGEPLARMPETQAAEPNVADRAYFKDARDRGTPVIKPASRSQIDGKIHFTFGRPFHRPDGAFGGIVVAKIDPAVLTGFHDLLAFDADPLVLVATEHGDIVARRPDLARYLGRNLAETRLFAVERPARSEGNFVFRSPLDGTTRIAAFLGVRDYGLVIVTGVDEWLALAGWRTRSLRSVATMLAATLFLVGIGYWGWRSMKRQRFLQKRVLVEAARRRSLGDALRQARLDPLTELPGRSFLAEHGDAMARDCADRGMTLSVLFVDLDHFKSVNDTFGHERGDEVLVEVARILRGCLREHDVALRLGGDEFLILAEVASNEAEQVTYQLANRLSARLDEAGLGVRCSIGIALRAEAKISLSEAIAEADEAMYEAKRRKGSASPRQRLTQIQGGLEP